jgi:hypothetical protein
MPLAEHTLAPPKPLTPDKQHDCGCITYFRRTTTVHGKDLPLPYYRHACPSHKRYAERLGLIDGGYSSIT